MSSERKAVIKNADMSEEMQQDAVDCATQALEKYNIEKVNFLLFLLFFFWLDCVSTCGCIMYDSVSLHNEYR